LLFAKEVIEIILYFFVNVTNAKAKEVAEIIY
jgi:hypothetical protein